MKKVIFGLMTVFACLLFSCTKTIESQQEKPCFSNIVIPEHKDAKESNNSYLLQINVGHSSSECKGRCIKINGTPTHVDCMGYGYHCTKLSSVILQQTDSTITAITTDTFDLTSEDFFLVPDRSLEYVDEKENHIFLNIPGQLVYRDTTTLQFTFTGLFFSETAAYSNN